VARRAKGRRPTPGASRSLVASQLRADAAPLYRQRCLRMTPLHARRSVSARRASRALEDVRKVLTAPSVLSWLALGMDGGMAAWCALCRVMLDARQLMLDIGS